MKKIIILGGGFAGVAAGIKLRKRLKDNTAEIILIDENSYHLFTPSLYEVATSEEPQKNIAIPLRKIFEDGLAVVKDRVEKINQAANTISLKNDKEMQYDYLVIALGSQPAYFNIPGLKEKSIAFKSIQSAVEIRNKIDTLYCKVDEKDRKTKVVIGGGGFAGTELASEILTYRSHIAKEHDLSADCLEITIIQGSDRLLKELDGHVSALAQKRLNWPGVTFAFGGHITEVKDDVVLTDDGKKYPYDILIWTGGVQANDIAAKSGLAVNKRGQVVVNDFLQAQGSSNIFAAGDIAGFVDPKAQKPVPNVAQVAEEQGAAVAENIERSLKNQQLVPYHYRHFGYVVPIRGRFAVAELMFGIHFDGFLGWCLQQIVFLRYLLGILPLQKALKRWNIFELELEQ